MPQPGKPNPRGEDWMVRKIQELEQSIKILAAANPFAAMGIKPMPDGLIVEGYETVNGPLQVNGDATFTGNMAVEGTLSLPAGIIDNEALASPVKVGRTSNAETNFAMSTSDVTYAATTIPIPAGFTQALVFVVCNVGVINTTGSHDIAYASALIQGSAAREIFGTVYTGFGSAMSTAKSELLTGLSGGNVTVGVQAHAQSAPWAAHSANRAYVEAQAVFLR